MLWAAHYTKRQMLNPIYENHFNLNVLAKYSKTCQNDFISKNVRDTPWHSVPSNKSDRNVYINVTVLM